MLKTLQVPVSLFKNFLGDIKLCFLLSRASRISDFPDFSKGQSMSYLG